jgi:hypothetical protein
MNIPHTKNITELNDTQMVVNTYSCDDENVPPLK